MNHSFNYPQTMKLMFFAPHSLSLQLLLHFWFPNQKKLDHCNFRHALEKITIILLTSSNTLKLVILCVSIRVYPDLHQQFYKQTGSTLIPRVISTNDFMSYVGSLNNHWYNQHIHSSDNTCNSHNTSFMIFPYHQESLCYTFSNFLEFLTLVKQL